MKNQLEMAEKALLQGALTGLSSTLLHGRGTSVITPFGVVPMWALTGAVGASSAVVNDILHMYVFKEIPVNKKVRHELSIVLAAVTSGLLYNQALGLVNPALPEEYGYVNGILVGSGSEVLTGIMLDMLR